MMLRYEALDSEWVQAVRAGGPDDYGLAAERVKAEGPGNPCRHCLDFVPDGAEMLILAHRPFAALQPYAETGPIFLCGAGCSAHDGRARPAILQGSPDYLLKGYRANQRIFYGSGRVVAQADVEPYAQTLLADPDVAFVDVRSARNNCFQLRIRRGDPAGGAQG